MTNQAIRVGLIGLNAKDSWAVNAHLPYFKRTSRYHIVALLNSSEDAAKAAISAHGLDADTRAYGNADAFAKDTDIDLIVCSTRVDKHYPVLKPILEKTNAKAVHCEWPLGKNLAEAEELTALAKSSGIKTIVGLQGRTMPTSWVVKELVSSGRIGKMLSVTVNYVADNFGAGDAESLHYLSDITTGGNMVTIKFSHMLDTITSAIGQLASYSVLLETKRPKTLLLEKPHTLSGQARPAGGEEMKVVGEVPRTAHDQVLLQGHLEGGVIFSCHMRGGPSFLGTPALDWRIYGEDGEIRVTTPSANLHFGGPGHRVQIHDHKSNQVQNVELPETDYDKLNPPWPSRGPARVYEAYADGKEELYADWDEAVRRHRLVEEMYARAREGGADREARYMQ